MRFRIRLLFLSAALCMAIGAWGFGSYHQVFERFIVRVSVLGPVPVAAVVDGDSFYVFTLFGVRFEVRPVGINAKELAHGGRHINKECWGPEGYAYARTLLEGKVVTLRFDQRKGMYDDYHRLLAYVWVYDSYLNALFGIGGFDFNLRMIETGNAEEWQYRGPYQRAGAYLAAETKAREQNLGGWAKCGDFDKHPRKH